MEINRGNELTKMSEEVKKWLNEMQICEGVLVPTLKYALRNAKKIVALDLDDEEQSGISNLDREVKST